MSDMMAPNQPIIVTIACLGAHGVGIGLYTRFSKLYTLIDMSNKTYPNTFHLNYEIELTHP